MSIGNTEGVMMYKRQWLIYTAIVTATAFLAAAAEPPVISVERIRADVKYLASDRLEGRGIGTRGEELATDYIASEFKKAGLQPAGERGSFFQTVRLVGVTTNPQATLSAARGDQTIAFTCGEEFVGQSKTQQPVEQFDAEAVFLGHGIVAPEYGWDDYQEVDVKGKVVVLFTNEPPSEDPKFFQGKALTYYGRWTFKFEEATRRGARAALIIHTNETAGYPFSVVKSLEGAEIQRSPGTPALAFAGWLSRQAGEKLLALAGKTVEGALQEADTRGFKAFPLGVRIRGNIPTQLRKIVTKNVLGLVEGSDPARKSEAVIFTAHWDHLGIGTAPLGDNIYNGAADNATGCALLLELARAWAAQQPRPKRSALFLATTAEESGLLGAEYYARNPVIPLGKTALNLNFDTVFPLGVPESVVVHGAERTTAWPVVQEVARRHRLDIEPDRQPEQGFYYRSDHFALARGGVPAFSLDPGTRVQGKPADYYKKTFESYNTQRYHTPADEYREDWDFSGFPVLIRFALDVGREAANGVQLPTWVAGDEFLPARQKSGVR
jgi:Zn-dependent M28 family amino/carboxypeptidase